MKKANRKLIPAVAMLLVSAIMLSTASFAWFSMNDTVKATGMTVKAVSNDAFLQIANKTQTFSDPGITVSAANSSKLDLLPVHPANSTYNSGDYVSKTHKLTGSETFSTIKWITASATAANEADAKAGTYALIKDNTATDSGATEGKLAEAKDSYYSLYNEFFVRLKFNNAELAKPLYVKSAKLTAAAGDSISESVRVAFVGANGYSIWKFDQDGKGTQEVGAAKGKILDKVPQMTTSSGTEESKIQTYIYYDGEDPTCSTDLAAVGKSYAVEFELTINEPA